MFEHIVYNWVLWTFEYTFKILFVIPQDHLNPIIIFNELLKEKWRKHGEQTQDLTFYTFTYTFQSKMFILIYKNIINTHKSELQH